MLAGVYEAINRILKQDGEQTILNKNFLPDKNNSLVYALLKFTAAFV